MILHSDLPRLTLAEAERCWMQPIDICELAILGDEHRPETRKFLANISDRGYVDFVKSGESKTSPKLYSLKSAVMLKVFRSLTNMQHSYEFSRPIAEKAYEVTKELIATLHTPHDIAEDDWFIFFSADYKGDSSDIRVCRSADVTASMLSHYYIDAGAYINIGFICFNILRRYGDYWSYDRFKRRVDPPAGRYHGCDLNGLPLDPSHPWNRDLPPLEYAKRLVEIEEYIEARDKKSKSL